MKTNEKVGELSTILGKGSKFEGKIKVEHSLRIDGHFKGDIITSDTLVIGKEGKVEGSTKAKDIIVGGSLSGAVIAEGKLVLEAKAVFDGDLTTKRLVVDEGAILEGHCSMKPAANSPQASSVSRGEESKSNN
jgi:cytoskeletal protein CcmA (bactofilin family)